MTNQKGEFIYYWRKLEIGKNIYMSSFIHPNIVLIVLCGSQKQIIAESMKKKIIITKTLLWSVAERKS